MPTTPSPAQSEASRLNGAHSTGPATAAGKTRSALNGVRHGLSGRTFFLLPDEDPSEFRRHEAMWLAVWSPRDLHEHEAAACRHPRHVARDPRRPTGGAGALRPVRRRRDRRRCRAAGRQGRRHQGPGHAAALPSAHRARASRAMADLDSPAPAPSGPASPARPQRTRARRRQPSRRWKPGRPTPRPYPRPPRAASPSRRRTRARRPPSTATSAARSPP